jgi:hypothetical protein
MQLKPTKPELELISAGMEHFRAVDGNDIRELRQDTIDAIAYAKDADNPRLYIYTKKPFHIVEKTLATIDTSGLDVHIAFYDDLIRARIEAQRDGAMFAEVS